MIIKVRCLGMRDLPTFIIEASPLEGESPQLADLD